MELQMLPDPERPKQPVTYADISAKITDIRPSKKRKDQTTFLYDGVRHYVPTPNPEQFILSDNPAGRLWIAVRHGQGLVHIRRAPVNFRILPRNK